jgi:hypothetical protein
MPTRLRNVRSSPALCLATSALGLAVSLTGAACGGGKLSTQPPPPPPPAASTCALPAASNPTGGGGTAAQIQIDPNVYGTADVSNLTVWAFSQQPEGDPPDPQVLEAAPSIVPRAWQRWDRGGLAATDYNFGYSAAAHAAGITFIGGTTATALFSDEFSSSTGFSAVVSCNASGQPVPHPPLNFYRGSLAAPGYRQYLINIAKLQIDGGVDGLFFDEIDQSFEGATYGEGNEGFDDADVADFGGFLCGKYPGLSAAQWASQFQISSADKLDCTLVPDKRGRSFDYRGYLARHGWQTTPRTGPNPLAAEWGSITSGHPNLGAGTFVETYPSLVWWQDMVLTLRTYARQKYGKEIYITANGIFPFVDFQMDGLWDGNPDGPNNTSVDYLPVVNGHLNGSVSLLPAFLGLKTRSLVTAGRIVPVALFMDWPTDVISRYFALPQSERQDYVRMYLAEAYAAGVYFNMHLADTIGDPTAQQQGMMPLFDQLSAFYKAHVSLYHSAQDQTGPVNTSASKISSNLTLLPDGTVVAHLINHNYSQAFQLQSNVTVTFPMAHSPASVKLVSPDYSADTPVSFSYANGQVQVTVPQLDAYVAVVAK